MKDISEQMIPFRGHMGEHMPKKSVPTDCFSICDMWGARRTYGVPTILMIQEVVKIKVQNQGNDLDWSTKLSVFKGKNMLIYHVV